MKYVAFLDILGFKSKLKKLSQVEARKYISDFSYTIYYLFRRKNYNDIYGYIVSDSIILYTGNVEQNALNNLLNLVIELCQSEYTDNKILIRGAITKGEFDEIPAKELLNLQKELIVGQAYVDAYLLEDSIKSIGIVVNHDVYNDIINLNNCDYNILNESSQNEEKYILSFLDFNFMNLNDNLKIFVDLAVEASWLPHFYNGLYLIIRENKQNNEIYAFFDKLIECFGNPGEEWRNINTFIKNSFNDNVDANFQTRFLGYIRNSLFANKNKKQFLYDNRLGNREKILEFLEGHPNSTLRVISNSLGISISTTNAIIKKLLLEELVAEKSITSINRNKSIAVRVFLLKR